jgi:hypothetical protein
VTINYAECRKQAHYGECHYAECHYAEYCYAECRGAINHLFLIKKILDLNRNFLQVQNAAAYYGRGKTV